MNSWKDNLKTVEIEKRRWAVLSHLEKSKPARSLSTDILIMGCRASGVPTNSDEMAQAVHWLEEQQFVKVETLGALTVATITPSGREVAQGHRVLPGLIPFGLDG